MSEQSMAENVTWTPVLETYFADTAEKCLCLSWIHRRSEAVYNARRTWIDLPVIVLSSVTGFLQVGANTLFTGREATASVSLGLVSLFVSVLNTLTTYFGWSKRAEGHRISGISYSKLHRFIRVEMALPASQRMAAPSLLKTVRDHYDRLAETSPPLPPEVIAEFRTRFSIAKYEAVSKPEEANGLETVSIYRGPDPLIEALQIRTPTGSPESMSPDKRRGSLAVPSHHDHLARPQPQTQSSDPRGTVEVRESEYAIQLSPAAMQSQQGTESLSRGESVSHQQA